MTKHLDTLAEQLKQTTKLAGARWAAWLKRSEEGWDFHLPSNLSKTRQAALEKFIAQPSTSTWLAGAFSSGRTRSRGTSEFASALGCERVYAFANPTAKSVLLLGCNSLSGNLQGFLRILAQSDPAAQAAPEIPLSKHSHLWRMDTGPDFSYSPQHVMDWVLETLAGVVHCQAAYLAVRLGDTLRIEATWNYCEAVKATEFSILGDALLTEMIGTRQSVVLDDLKPDFRLALNAGLPKLVKSSLLLPILIDDRVIGVGVCVAFRSKTFSALDLQRAEQYLERLGHTIENALIFGDMSRYLQQFALLNELARAASIGTETAEVARAVVHRLRRAFRTDLVAVLMRSSDGKNLLEYGIEPHDEPLVIPIATSLVGYVAEHDTAVRVGDVRQAPRFLDERRAVISALAVPLKYQGRVIGVIAVESTQSNAFTTHDEQLLGVIASHLAGLFENVRLYDETSQRAGNLSLIHQVVQKVVGLTNLNEIAQVTADLIAEYFGYEVTVITNVDETDHLVVLGSGGTWASTIERGFRYPVTQGLTGKVFRTGTSIIINDVSQDPDYITFLGWKAGSEMCIPLREGDRVIGLINLERTQKHAFSSQDLNLFESLAGILASVMMNASRHRALEEQITSRLAAEKRLLLSTKLAAIGEMAAGVAHEVSNPLTTVAGFIELALKELPLDHPLREDLELAYSEACRAKVVVRRLLNFSRASEPVRSEIDLNELIGEVLALVQHQAEANHVKVRFEPFPGLPYVFMAAGQIKQVLLNLIQNALQAMPEGGLLALRTARDERQCKAGAAIAIQDSGQGIAPENMEHIFEPFFTTRPGGQGTGLGLSISYGIVSEHGGLIDVESTPGSGSCFTVWLPVDKGVPHD